MILKDLDIYSFQYNTHKNQSEFNLETNSTVTLYLRNLGKYNTSQFAKINIVAHEKLKTKAQIIPLENKSPEEMKKQLLEGNYYYENFIEPMGDVLCFHRKFDFDNYFLQTDSDKKSLIVNYIHDAILFLSNHFNWNQEQLKTALDETINQKIDNNFWLGKLKSSTNRKFKAGIYCEYGLYSFDIYAIVFSKDGEKISQKLLISSKPSEYDFVELLGKTIWDKNEFCLFGKNQKIIGKAIVKQNIITTNKVETIEN